MDGHKVTICPTKYAEGYREGFFEEFKPTGGTYINPGSKDKYTRMANLRAKRVMR
jgi:hypothetical protein